MVAEWSDCSPSSSGAAEKLNSVLHNGSPRPSQCGKAFKAQTMGAQANVSSNKISEDLPSPEVCSSATIAQSELDKKFYYISSQNHDFLLSSSLSKLAVVDGYQDVIVLCDGHTLAAHKLVLAAASHFLKAIFQSIVGTQPAYVTIEGVKWPILCHIMQYVYIGESYVQQDDVAEFIAAGRSLGICGLQDLHEYLLDHQQITSKHFPENNVEDVEESEELQVIDEPNGTVDLSSNLLPVTSVTGAEVNGEVKPAFMVITDGFSTPASEPAVMSSTTESIPGQSEVKLPYSLPLSFDNNKIVSRSMQNQCGPVQNFHGSKLGCEIDDPTHHSLSNESIIENKCKSPKPSDVLTSSYEAPYKRLKLSNQTQDQLSEQDLECKVNHEKILPQKAEFLNYAGTLPHPGLPLHFEKPVFVNNTPETKPSVHPRDKSSNSANIGNSSHLPLPIWQNTPRGDTSGASSSSIFFNGLEIRPADRKWQRGSPAFDASSHHLRDMSPLPRAHPSSHGHYGTTFSEAWKEKSAPDAFPSAAQPYGVDGQAIGKLLSALAAQNTTGRLEQRETALPNDTITNNTNTNKIDTAVNSASNHRDFLKSDPTPFPLGGGLPPQVLSKLNNDRTLAGDATPTRDKISTSESVCGGAAAATDSLHKTSNGVLGTTPVLPVPKFATQEEIEVVLDQYQRKLAFHEPRPCPCCDRMYRDAATLRTHLGIMHTPGTEPFVCSCGAQFKTKYEMHHHKKNGHYLTGPPYS